MKPFLRRFIGQRGDDAWVISSGGRHRLAASAASWAGDWISPLRMALRSIRVFTASNGVSTRAGEDWRGSLTM